MNNYEHITQSILTALENGTPAWRRPWRTLRAAGAATMPRNAVTGRSYRGINVPLLLCAPYSDQRYLTFKQALDQGGNVRKGEHGQHVTFWQQNSYKERAADGTETTKRGLLLRVYTVFNVAQCDGLDLPGCDPMPETDVPELMRTVYAGTGAVVTHGGDRACYQPDFDRIALPIVSAFATTDGYAATAFHELGHWTGAKKRLDRDLTGRFRTRAYAAEELVAELTSAYLCAEYGLNQSLDHHASYIASWRELLTDDPRAVITAASKAQAAADYITAAVTGAAIVPDDTAEAA